VEVPLSHRIVVDVIVRPDYAVRYEQFDDLTFVHVDVHRWGSRIAREFRADIDAAHRLLGRPVYALERPEAPNQRHFLKLHGFEPCGRVRDAQGREVEIFGRSINGIALRRFAIDQQ
jgi:hypothetical protein